MNTTRKIRFQIPPRTQIHGANGSLERVMARAGQALACQDASGSVRRSIPQTGSDPSADSRRERGGI